MNGFQGPEHLWFLHERYFGLFEREYVIMRDSDFACVFYILSSLERYRSSRPFEYWITYEGNDMHSAKKIINEYSAGIKCFTGEDICPASYVKNLL